MKILTTSAAAQTLTFTPRAYPSSVTVSIRDNSTNTTTRTQNVTLTRVKDNATVSTTYTLVEGRFYDLTLLNGSATVYRDKIFCTTQTINQSNNNYYDINSGEYTFDETAGSHDNDYIIV